MKNSSNNGDAAGLPPAGGSGWHDEGKRNDHAPLNDTLQHVIGSQLKAAYDEVVRQPVPDRFLELLAKLDSNPSDSKDAQSTAGTEEGQRA